MIATRPPIKKWLYRSIASVHPTEPWSWLHYFQPEKPEGTPDLDDAMMYEFAIVELLDREHEEEVQDALSDMGLTLPIERITVYEVTRMHDIGAKEFVAVW